MPDSENHMMGLILGRWQSQMLHAVVGLVGFSVLREYANRAVEIVDQRDVDRNPPYRLLCALVSLESFDGSNETVSYD